jgi:hypothetical protein
MAWGSLKLCGMWALWWHHALPASLSASPLMTAVADQRASQAGWALNWPMMRFTEASYRPPMLFVQGKMWFFRLGHGALNS